MIRYNNLFRNLVGDEFQFQSIKPCKYSLTWNVKDVVEINHCYYFTKLAYYGKLSPMINKMEFEFQSNKIRVDDLIDSKIGNAESFQCGLSMTKDITEHLVMIGGGFEIVLSYNFEHCFITFYKIRKRPSNIISENLEGFLEEAVLLVTV